MGGHGFPPFKEPKHFTYCGKCRRVHGIHEGCRIACRQCGELGVSILIGGLCYGCHKEG